MARVLLLELMLTVVLQQNGALVVLIKNVFLDFITLGFQKQLGPGNWGGTVIHSDQFSFSAASSFELLLGGLVNGKTASISHSATCVALKIRVDSK